MCFRVLFAKHLLYWKQGAWRVLDTFLHSLLVSRLFVALIIHPCRRDPTWQSNHSVPFPELHDRRPGLGGRKVGQACVDCFCNLVVNTVETRHEILVVHRCFEVVPNHFFGVSETHVLLDLLPCAQQIVTL